MAFKISYFHLIAHFFKLIRSDHLNNNNNNKFNDFIKSIKESLRVYFDILMSSDIALD